MKTTTLALAAALTLTACASQPPQGLEAIHMAAKARITYENYAARDFRYIPQNETAAGNCAVFAMTVLVDANMAGFDPKMHVCSLPDGTGHAYTRVGDWDSDVRFKRLIPASQQDCR